MHGELQDAVGPGRANHHEDVLLVQRLLARQSARLVVSVNEDGRYGPGLDRAVRAYQRRLMRMTFPDGVVAPRSATFLELTLASSARLRAGWAGRLRLPPRSGQVELTDEDFSVAARSLGCEPAVVKAVAENESPRGPFDDSLGRPTILFERHIFAGLTQGRFNALFPDISNRLPGGYGTFASQYERLTRAYALSADAALESASWGKFQIMGSNYATCGFASVQLFVYAMCDSVQEHLKAFTAFVAANPTLVSAFRRKDWATIALYYNGPRYRINHYDEQLREHYEHNLR